MEQYKYTNELQHFGRRGMKWGQNVYKKEESGSGRRSSSRMNDRQKALLKSNSQNRSKVSSFMSDHNVAGKLKTAGKITVKIAGKTLKATAIGAAVVGSVAAVGAISFAGGAAGSVAGNHPLLTSLGIKAATGGLGTDSGPKFNTLYIR